MNVLLDTGVLIDALRRDDRALDFLEALSDVPAATEVTRVELVQGLRSPERRDAERLMSTIGWIPLTEPIARLAGRLGRRWRASHRGIGVADLVIAATVDLHGLELATTNVRHFPMLEGLQAPY
ncbi:type II toxin-antitoxin system VapC family toxin [soil metagenome]